jgi:hypothetical protein
MALAMALQQALDWHAGKEQDASPGMTQLCD